ncbi:general substrate transporter [Canariomyces notabilis]|uniref:General substrate transporter n=1 Tax=Canariomyces notabilis TaxID=2074819 RepID=A0AAN6QCJ5_9PEZI|nr:general substrate transporter [Canariomyces arenarius]
MFQVGSIYVIAAVAVIGGALFGFDISSMSAIISTQPYLCAFYQRGFDEKGHCLGPTDAVQGGITAAMPGGSSLGSLVSGLTSDRFGRKTSIQIGSVIWVVGCIVTSASVNIPMLAAGRIICGFSVGICSAQVPVYISELAPRFMRGRPVGFQQWAVTWGILIIAAAFRLPWGIQALPAVLLFVGLVFLPESSRWLAKKDREDEVKKVLDLVHGKGDPNSPLVLREMEEIRKAVDFERANADVSYLELLAPNMINRTSIGVFTQIWSQLTGMNVMMYYTTYVFDMARLGGGGTNAVLLPSGINFVINVLMTVPALLWMDRWGRRPTLLVGAFLMCLWLCVNAGVFAVYSREPYPGEFTSTAESMALSGAPAKVVIASTYLFVASFAPTWGPVSWTYPPEVYPLRLRGKAVALCTSANWAFNFALAYFVPPGFATIKWKIYVLFAVFCATMFVHVFFMFPETANKPLEEIEEIFDDTKEGGKVSPSRFFVSTEPWLTNYNHSYQVHWYAAWKTRNNRALALQQERDGIQLDERPASQAHHETAEV